MPRNHAWPLLVAGFGLGAVSCRSPGRPSLHGDAAPGVSGTASAPAPVSRSHAPLTHVREGMSAPQVRELIGPPDERRAHPPGGPKYVGEEYRWAYGVKVPGTFASRGLIVFNGRDQVVTVRTPISDRGGHGSSTEAGNFSSQLVCELGAFKTAKDGGHLATVTLSNQGTGAFEVPQSGCPEWSQLTISALAEDGTELCRLAFEELCSPYSPGELPPWRFEPLQHRSRELDWSHCWSEFGPLPPGRYLAQASFPTKSPATSARVAFEVR